LLKAPAEASHASFERHLPALSRFYAARQFQPVWTSGGALSPAGNNVVNQMRRAADEGLNPEDYLVDLISTTAARPDLAKAADLEVLIALAVTRYAHDLGWGITVPSEVDASNAYAARPFVAEDVIARVAGAADSGVALRTFEPPSFVYRQLMQALAELRAIRDSGGWTTASEGPALKLKDTGPRVGELKTILVERGDLSSSAAGGDTFDAALADALKRFQDRHGLSADGVYGKAVIAEINVSIPTRIQQLRLAMERMRWLPPASTGRRIGVNLADFRAYVFDGDAITFETRAVVGKQYHETPMFASMMTYLVINPYWNVPPSIARSEILPKAKADPGYFQREHLEMDGTAVRQRPGPWNALGRFKFMFPNPHNIYLHDTPARTLFSLADRAFSHGCVRIEKPAELAALLLAPQGWTPERIQAAVATGQQTVVTLTTPIPVTISYATAFRTPDGFQHYRRDVYGRDRKLLAALQQDSHGAWDR
jgi:murein L,D-transpeptidase YcbB/YkuD